MTIITVIVDKSLLEDTAEFLEDATDNLAKPYSTTAIVIADKLRTVLAAQPAKPLFADLIAQHEGLADELAAMDTQPSAPAWHDAPTEPGLWTVEMVQVVDKSQIKRIETLTDRRWFGPISPDKIRSGE